MYEKVDEVLKDDTRYTPKLIDETKLGYKEVFKFIIDTLNLPDIDKPLKLGGGGELDLYNPMSTAVALLMYLYTIEPPFYFYVNQACI